MVEIPNSLRSLFSAPIKEQDGTYIVEVPSSEIDFEALSADETYRVAILESPVSTESSVQQESQRAPLVRLQAILPQDLPWRKAKYVM